jgi:heptosyltransferase-2
MAEQIAVFLPNWIGDAVMATPALRALRRQFSAARLLGVMRPYVADVLRGTALLDEHVLYAPRSPRRDQRSWALVWGLRQRSLDISLLMTNSLRTGLLSWFCGARRRVGYVRYGRGVFLTDGLPPPRAADGSLARVPMVEYYLQLAYALGCPPEPPRLELATTAEDEQAADEAFSRVGLHVARPLVTLNCSGAFGAAKLWPPEYFSELARRIATHADHQVLVLCGPSERALAAAIARQAAHRRVASLADEPLSLGLSKACVRRSRLLVTTDSGPRQFAVAFGVPLVSLFGPTPPVWGANPTARETCLQVELDCLGCHRRTCPLKHHRCMRDLTVDRVYAAVAQALQGGGQLPHAA